MSKDNSNLNDNASQINWKQEMERLQYEQLKEASDEAKEQKRVHMEARRQNANRMVEQQKRKQAEQQWCSHKKPFGGTALCGQGVGGNAKFYICAYCHAEFNENTVPAMLRPSPEHYGGVNY